MQLDALALRMRPRTLLESADLGARLAQSTARSVYACYAVVYVPIAALAFATFEIAAWLPTLVLFWSKPWLDRTILYVLSRAAFGQTTLPRQLWAGVQESINPTITAAAVVLMLVSVALMVVVEMLRRRGARLRGAS